MASLKDLLEWCRLTCASYQGVDIRDMSSFRDGLAFCAIIHKHRPDLIDFSSLSTENVYQNNKLAFEVAETALGIPALMDPKDLASIKVPDCLSVITYISQYYYFFNGKSCGSSRSGSSHILNNITKSHKTPNSWRSSKSSTDLETSRETHFDNMRTGAVCSLCFKPVHLIQRCLSYGKLYHRSCFRCKICHNTLIFDSGDPGSLRCSSHVTDSKTSCVNLSQQFRPTDNRPICTSGDSFSGFYSLDGLAITSVPHYAQKIESHDRCVGETPRPDENREMIDGENSSQFSVNKRTTKGGEKRTRGTEGKVQQDAVNISYSATEGSTYPVPAPRRSLDSSMVPVPAPRTKLAQMMSCSLGAEISEIQSNPPGCPCVTSPKVKTSHPWMAIVHPGPWSQLPPAPPPIPLPRSKSTCNTQGSSSRRRIPPPNPFEEEEVEESQEEAATTEESSVAAHQSENSEGAGDGFRSRAAKDPVAESECATEKTHSEEGCGELEAAGVTHTEGGPAAQVGSSDVKEAVQLYSASAQNQNLPRSLPAITSEHSETNSEPSGEREANGSVTSCDRKSACKENAFTGKPELSKSKTFQNLSFPRGPAPGHGFPLIRRKVQTDECVSMEALQKQRNELDRCLEGLEQQGIELERKIRDGINGKEEQMLTDWIKLFHERQVQLHKDREFIYLIKQQMLEDKQADVEYELRCLLNKPEKDWSQEDRHQEQQLMEELVTVIEQRNQIISSLDQDRQREKYGDMMTEGTTKNKDFQDGLKEQKKSKGKFKPAKVFRMLNHKTESNKDSVEKKN